MFIKKNKNHETSSILFNPPGEKVTIGTSKTVLDVALRHNIEIPHSCEGMGTCTTCRVILAKNPVSGLLPRTSIENEVAIERGFLDDERLACQLIPCPGMEIYIPNYQK